MRLWIGILAALPCLAGAISPPVEVSNNRSQVLNPEDKLLFTVSDWSFQVNAMLRGLPEYPTDVTFQLVSSAQSGTGPFTAWWQLPDGSVADAFPGTFVWLPGRIQSSGYTGPVSALYGSMALPSSIAAELFGGSSAVLVLENEGGPVTVGLPGYTLQQDLSVSLSDGHFGVSGPVVDVKYIDPPLSTPEPNSGWILIGAGLAVCLVARILNRISHRGVQ